MPVIFNVKIKDDIYKIQSTRTPAILFQGGGHYKFIKTLSSYLIIVEPKHRLSQLMNLRNIILIHCGTYFTNWRHVILR